YRNEFKRVRCSLKALAQTYRRAALSPRAQAPLPPAVNNWRMYSERFPARTEFVRVRSLDYHVWRWGVAEGGTPLVLVHGWMDVGASYQFMVDALPEDFVSGRPI